MCKNNQNTKKKCDWPTRTTVDQLHISVLCLYIRSAYRYNITHNNHIHDPNPTLGFTVSSIETATLSS